MNLTDLTLPAFTATGKALVRDLGAALGLYVADAPPPVPPLPAVPELVLPGAPLPTDDEARRFVQHCGREQQSINTVPNVTTPTANDLAQYRANAWGGVTVRANDLRGRVTGAFVGTTDDIFQWVAWKWGLPHDLVRAVAWQESTWRQDRIGDAGNSYGITQVKRTAHLGTYSVSAMSTAFAADYWGAWVRAVYEGEFTWLRTKNAAYAAGDIWGAIGAWFSGTWYDGDPTLPLSQGGGARRYITDVQGHMAARPWRSL